MQGTAADIIKRAMIDIQNWLQTEQSPIKMIMQVHDELVFEIPNELLDDAKQKIEALMTQAAKLAVPLDVGIDIGNNWEQAH